MTTAGNILDMVAPGGQLVSVEPRGGHRVTEAHPNFILAWDRMTVARVNVNRHGYEYVHGYSGLEYRRLEKQVKVFWPQLFPKQIFSGTVPTVMDFGCGPGWGTAALQGRYPDSSIFGMDIKDETIRIARSEYKGGCEFYVHDIFFPWPVQYAGVFSCFVLEHMGISQKELIRHSWHTEIEPVTITLTGEDLTIITQMLSSFGPGPFFSQETVFEHDVDILRTTRPVHPGQ